MARPEPMNATPAHSKAKVSVYFPDPLFVAGEHVTGKVELECKAERGLGICDIKVELFAIQELTSRDHSATNTFMHLTRYFQGPGLPPSNAVHPHPLPGADDALPVDYYLARKGTTTFFFRFPLPSSSPASIDFGKGLAKLKYEVRASVGISWRMERQRVMERKEVPVVEAPGTISDNEQIVVGENGKIWIQGRLLNPYVVAGQDACVELFVKNHSTKKTTSLNLSLTRHLHLPTVSHIQKALQISDVLLNIPFRGPEYIVQPGTEGIANLVFTVPKNAQGVRPGRLDSGEEEDSRGPIESLFDIRCLLEIKIGMGIGNKDIIVELPVSVVHPVAMSLLPPPALDHYATSPEPPQRVYSPPTYPLSAYQSPMLGPLIDPYAASYISPPTSPPIFPPNLPLWSPAPPGVQPQMMHDQYYYYPPPPVMGYAYPVRPSSADPLVAQQLPILPTQPIAVAASSPMQDTQSPVIDSPATPVEQGEPGKGERASRISAHLRMSSRTRSVSPQSHRFPQSPLVPNLEGSPGKALAIQPPINEGLLSASPNPEDAPVLSPRPVLTPKQSFSIDRGTVKSEHVIDLERMAAEELAGASIRDDRNKTLPPHPAASESPTPVFPPEPKLSPITTRQQRPELWGRDSGLAALERKLLEQVGTRKPEPERRADVRSVLPGPIAIPPTNDPRYDPLNDSAISSLALGADVSFRHPQSPPVEEPITKLLPSSPPLETTVDVKKTSLDHREVNGGGREKQRHVNNLRKAATGRVAAWLGGLGSASPPPEPETPDAQSPDALVEDLPSPPADIDPHPLLRSPAVPPPKTPEEPRHDSIPTRSSGFVLHAAKDTSSSFETPRINPSAQPNTGSPSQAGVNPVHGAPSIISPLPLKPVFRRIADFSPKEQASGAKYDIRSARGGRGGKVTSVATLWASLASQQESTSSSAQSPQKVGTFSPTFRGAQTRLSSDKQEAPMKAPPHVKKRHDIAATNVADLTARRARMVKSTSDPAVVSSSLATPVLSSTASLARPIQVYPTHLYPTTNASATAEYSISGSSTPKPKLVSSPGPVDLGFGQARLKDLIKKYQQGFGQ